MVRTVVLVISVLVLATASLAHAQTPVTTCGQVVTKAGVLTSDLDCTGFDGAAVVVASSVLDLAGFTLTGGNDAGVVCDVRCVVRSDPPGGVIRGSLGRGIDAGARGPHGWVRVTARDITVEANQGDGIYAFGVKSLGSTITGNGGDGIYGGSLLKVRDSTITNNSGSGVGGFATSVKDSVVSGNGGTGVSSSGCDFGRPVKLKGTIVTGNGGHGVWSCKGRVIDSVVEDNALNGIWSSRGRVVVRNSEIRRSGLHGIHANAASIKGSTITDNDVDGVHVRGDPRTSIRDSQVTGNGHHGVFRAGGTSSRAVLLRDVVVTGNGGSVDCGVTETCADVASSQQPRIGNNVICDTSYYVGTGFPGQTWGVCTLD